MSEWKQDIVKTFAESFAGGTPNRSRNDFYNGEIPWISSGEVNQPYITDTKEKITELGLENSSAKWIPKDSVLVAMYGATAGQVSKNLIKATSNQAVLALIPFKQLIDNDFLYYQIKQNKEFILYLSQGSGQPNLSKDLIDNFIIKVPVELTEQRKIAKILSTADAVIEKTQVAIDKYKAIKQGMLNDLFTRGIDISTGKLRPKYEEAPELYKESKLGWVPKEWDVERLELLTEKIGSGVTPTGGSEVYGTSGVLFIRSQNVLVGRLSTKDIAYISSEIDDRMQFSRVKPFDVLLNITGASIGRCAFFPENLKSANVNQHVCIIRFSNTSKEQAILASEFLNSDFGQSQINRSNAGGNRDGLNFQQIKSFSFPVIDFSEIERISATIETITNKLQAEQTYLSKLQKIKAGLMSDLLSGKKKVTVKEKN
jgi:type I restriction enzyme S subunit